MRRREKIYVSRAMAIAEGNALLTARGDLFDFLFEQSAQEIAVSVYEAMALAESSPECEMQSL